MIRVHRLLFVAIFALVAASVFAQGWQVPYEEGLQWARSGKWQQAREAFLKAAAARTDSSTPTTLPGPPTEQRQWRGGSPYSPGFLAAYAAYRQALETGDQAQASELLRTSASELEGLVANGQRSAEALYYLGVVYGKLGAADKKTALDKQFAEWGPITWRVDTEVLAPEDLAQIQASVPARAQPTQSTPVVAAGTENADTGRAVIPGGVPVLENKFALIIGNDSERIPFAAHDAARIKGALVTNAGYADANVVVLQNAGADQISAAATSLAERVPEEGTVLIYYTGAAGVTDGADHIAGLPKLQLYEPFVKRAARIFAFYQVNRTATEGPGFGAQMPVMGAIAQMQATVPNGTIERTIRDGKETGVFTEAFTEALADLRSNRIPVLEFGWQVFYKIRRGSTGTTGGGSSQTPTLPVLANLASDARF